MILARRHAKILRKWTPIRAQNLMIRESYMLVRCDMVSHYSISKWNYWRGLLPLKGTTKIDDWEDMYLVFMDPMEDNETLSDSIQ